MVMKKYRVGEKKPKSMGRKYLKVGDVIQFQDGDEVNSKGNIYFFVATSERYVVYEAKTVSDDERCWAHKVYCESLDTEDKVYFYQDNACTPYIDKIKIIGKAKRHWKVIS